MNIRVVVCMLVCGSVRCNHDKYLCHARVCNLRCAYTLAHPEHLLRVIERQRKQL